MSTATKLAESIILEQRSRNHGRCNIYSIEAALRSLGYESLGYINGWATGENRRKSEDGWETAWNHGKCLSISWHPEDRQYFLCDSSD